MPGRPRPRTAQLPSGSGNRVGPFSTKIAHQRDYTRIDMDGGKNNTVMGNICMGNSLSTPGRWPGILVGSSSHCSVTGNRCGDIQTPATQRVGIAESKGADHNLISANHLHGSEKAIEKVGARTQVASNFE